AITTLLLVTTEETRLEDLLARKVATGDIGATANTIIVMGSERVGQRVARMLSIVKHRGSAMSDEIAEYRITAEGLVLTGSVVPRVSFLSSVCRLDRPTCCGPCAPPPAAAAIRSWWAARFATRACADAHPRADGSISM